MGFRDEAEAQAASRVTMAAGIARVTSILAIPYGYTVTLSSAALLSATRLGAPSGVERLRLLGKKLVAHPPRR